MSQASITIANGAGATVRAAINDALAALMTLNAGSSAPATTYQYMLWADTANDLLKMRNAANSAWIIKGTLSAEYGGLPASSIVYAPGSPALLDATDVQAAIDELAARGAAQRGHIFGLTLSNAADADHDITIATGEAASDDAEPVLMRQSSAITKQADATFAEGTNQGGMVSGESLPTSGTVHWWLIAKEDGTTDICCNNHATSGLSPTLPTGFIYKRRIASIPTTSSNNILGFSQKGDEFLVNRILVLDGVTPANTNSISVTVPFTPQGVKVHALLTFAGSNGSASFYAIIRSLDEPDTAPGASNYDIYTDANSSREMLYRPTRTNTSAQIAYRVSTTSGAVISMFSAGWVDDRGRLG